MKRLSNTLCGCSKNEFGDIYQKVRVYEEKVYNAEVNYIINHILHDINAKYIKFLKLEDTILKQKISSNGLKRVILTLNISIL